MRYCNRWLYPENAKPSIIFDDECVCSGCRDYESRQKLEINWAERETMLEEIVYEDKKRGNSHDCIIPVSGGKESHFQVWKLKQKYGMNPLLVFFTHAFNQPARLRNLENLAAKSGCDLITYNAGLDSMRRLSRHMLETVSDITWQYHAGIRTFPFQVAVQRNILLIVWGEHGFAEMTGIVSLEDFVEFTCWTRKEHDMRGDEPADLIGKGGITRGNIRPYIYPTDEQIQQTEVRGIYLSNFFYWDANQQGELMIKESGFNTVSFKRDRTFNIYAKLDDHANDVHGYGKYLKFGYGRTTDDASMKKIRHGRLTREEGEEMVKEYDATEPRALGITKKHFYDLVESMRDPKIWEKKNVEWVVKDAAWMQPTGDAVEKARPQQSADRTFSPANRHLYYNPALPPLPKGDPALDQKIFNFKAI